MFSRWSKVLSDIFGVEEDREVIYSPCPFHNDRRPSMLVSPRIDYWICYAGCGKGKIRQLVSRYYDVGVMEAERMAPPIPISPDENLLPQFDENLVMKKKEHRDLLPAVDLEYNKKRVPQFILDRGFDRKTLREWECGLDEYSQGLTIPTKDESQRIVGAIVRRPEGWEPKYKYTEGFPRNKIIFGLNRVLELDEVPFVAITEGSLDTMWLWKFGYPSVSILGSNLSVVQKTLLAKMPTSEISLCFDNDKAGENVKEEVRKALGNFFLMSKISIPDKYKDIQDIKNERLIHEIIDNRSMILY